MLSEADRGEGETRQKEWREAGAERERERDAVVWGAEMMHAMQRVVRNIDCSGLSLLRCVAVAVSVCPKKGEEIYFVLSPGDSVVLGVLMLHSRARRTRMM